MYDRKLKCGDKETKYTRRLNKYESPRCPMCDATRDTAEHLTECQKTAAVRTNAVETLIKTLESQLDTSDEKELTTNKTRIATGVKKWLCEIKKEWKSKWSWYGYITTELVDTLKEIKWKDQQTQRTIYKKIQVTVTEAIHECWAKRCQALHKKEANEEQTKKMQERAQERCDSIQSMNKRVEKKKEHNARTAFVSGTSQCHPPTPHAIPRETTDSPPNPTNGPDNPSQERTDLPKETNTNTVREKRPRSVFRSIYDEEESAAEAAAATAGAGAAPASPSSAAPDDELLNFNWQATTRMENETVGREGKRTRKGLAEVARDLTNLHEDEDRRLELEQILPSPPRVAPIAQENTRRRREADEDNTNRPCKKSNARK